MLRVIEHRGWLPFNPPFPIFGKSSLGLLKTCGSILGIVEPHSVPFVLEGPAFGRPSYKNSLTSLIGQRPRTKWTLGSFQCYFVLPPPILSLNPQRFLVAPSHPLSLLAFWVREVALLLTGFLKHHMAAMEAQSRHFAANMPRDVWTFSLFANYKSTKPLKAPKNTHLFKKAAKSQANGFSV